MASGIAGDVIDAHVAATTGAHGGIVASSDVRLTDARTPTAHKASHQLGGSDVLALSQYDRDNKQLGIIAPGGSGWGTGGTAAVANRVYLARFAPSRNIAVTLISFATTVAAGSNDNCDVGIYDATLAKLASSGSTAGKLNGGVGVRTIALSYSLVAGTVYYAALAIGAIGTTAATLLMSSQGSTYASQLFGSPEPYMELGFNTNAAYFPLPASLAGALIAAQGHVGALLALRES